jgi:hypothetical protein
LEVVVLELVGQVLLTLVLVAEEMDILLVVHPLV